MILIMFEICKTCAEVIETAVQLALNLRMRKSGLWLRSVILPSRCLRIDSTPIMTSPKISRLFFF